MTPQETPPRTPSPEDNVPKVYGGLPVMTWKSYRENLRNSTPEYHLARDLPHKFQDHINFMSELARKYPQWSKNFEIMVAETNARDEPEAPPITLFNEVDDEPAPPWEFHYTNKMWLGENVPPPSYKALKSCGCVGKCDPKSKTCECVKRQEELTGFYQSGFLYEKNGLLKQAGLPILECNSLCGCDEDCMNRVVQNGRKCDVSVGKTREKGWGVFNGPKEIPRGTFIGIYAGELLADAVAEERGAKYNVFGRTYLFDIDFYYIKDMVKDWSGNSKYTVDAYHAGNFTRFLNHSCDPNAALTPVYIDESDWEKPLLTIFAKRNIPPWDEITFSYSGDPDNNEEEVSAQNDAVYTECRCGSRRCKGTMFGGYDEDEDEPEDDEFS
ncbi:SET domain-containing protein [Dendrothele bispora CBS 962.96]|uniref:SET domain-containing protein n=1 Tax=Dendrothele bispora (strain CBS 962.96) TaxID=1314807 RepID=A0A4S8LUP1_DENBC|nr:SET domain-containing protein [Dendrothele bispora CBS 962.96]